uniref:Uncharacterized protein n=1 Tax=Streptomyces sp. NBC_00093 TaxID=2975649 RepID=A0AAU2AC36_9ACTN
MPVPGRPLGLGGVSPVRGWSVGRGGAVGGTLRRRRVVSDSVSVRAVGRQGATGGWWVGRGGRSGRGRGAAGVRPPGGASGSRAEEGGGGGGVMGSVPSREGARRCGKRGGAQSWVASGVPGALVVLGAAVRGAAAPGTVVREVAEPEDAEPEDGRPEGTGPEAVPGGRVPFSAPGRGSDGADDTPGVCPDVVVVASSVAPGQPVVAPALPAPGRSPVVPASFQSGVLPALLRSAVDASAGVPKADGRCVPSGVLLVSSAVSSVAGGVVGRGGMEARRASVLMPPPVPKSVRRGTRPSRARIPARACRHPGAYLRARWLLPA